MDDRERLRLKLTHQVARMLQNRSLRTVLPPLRNGASTFVVGLPDDTMLDISERVMLLGGCAHLVVLTELENCARVKVFLVEESVKDLRDLDDERECVVNGDTSLEMFMAAIEVGDQLVFHVYESETIVRFINDSVQPPVPA